MTGFLLDPRLAADTMPVAELALSTLLLSRDARFPWLVLVPRRAGITEIIDLDAGDRATLIEEIARISVALRTATACDKLNVAALGNVVSQLHVHVVARMIGDDAWPGPVWGRGEAVAYEPAARDRLVTALRDLLPRP